MKFFHVYNEQYFEGLVKNNFINKNSGFKIQNCFAMPEEQRFNKIAAKGGKLHGFLKEGKYPFYIDRLVGGINYADYDIDRTLMREYKEMLGDWFFGFQLHESGSNQRYCDWGRLRQRIGHEAPYDLETIKNAMLNEHQSKTVGFPVYDLAINSPEYYANRPCVNTPAEFFEEMKEMFRTKMEECEGRILPADSGFVAMKLANEVGMQTFMPEVGHQIPQMRHQLAVTRGIAKNNGKIWGTYYECWFYRRDTGYSMPCFNKEPGNEWYLSQDLHPDDFTSYGPNGGSSRLLQRRIYYYSLMSGARYLAEEWGLNCSYDDMHDFTLSEYGKVKKEFIDTAEELGNMDPVTPFAIVLPCEYSVLEISRQYPLVGEHPDAYMRMPLDPAGKALIGHAQDVLLSFLAQLDEHYGNEGHTITNSRFGDMFDIIFEDAGEETFKNYAYLIDATGEGRLARKYAGSNVILSNDLDAMTAQVKALAPQVMPCTVDGLHWLVSDSEDGRRYLSIFNNEGNTRDLELGDVIDHRADRRVKVTFKEETKLEVIRSFNDGVKLEKIDDKNWYVTVPAAELVILSC